MQKFDDALLVEFLRRSYSAVDGLWFMKVEEKFSRDDALRLDNLVWKIMPKIQARKAKELLQIEGGGIKTLLRCQALKMTAEGYDFEIREDGPGEGRIVINRCPWYEILVKTGRTELAEPIFNLICTVEFGVWCTELGQDIAYEIDRRICNGGSCCEVVFRQGGEASGSNF